MKKGVNRKFRRKKRMMTKFLHDLVQKLSDIKSGRFEIRYGSRFLFIDVSVKKSKLRNLS